MANRKSSIRYIMGKRLKEFPYIAISPTYVQEGDLSKTFLENSRSAVLSMGERTWLFKHEKDRNLFVSNAPHARKATAIPKHWIIPPTASETREIKVMYHQRSS